MQGRPLPQQFRPGARVGDFIGGDAGEVVGGDVADAVAGGLDRVHFGARQVGQDVGHLRQLDPVQLQVLPGGEVTDALVVAAGDVGQGAQLLCREQPIGHRNAQHRAVTLDVEAVLQAQRAEFVIGQFIGQIAPRLVSELGNACLLYTSAKRTATSRRIDIANRLARGFLDHGWNQ